MSTDFLLKTNRWQPVLQRFLSKIRITKLGCWEWLGSKTTVGYGQIGFNGRTTTTHRFIYEYLYGKIDSKLQLDHLCRNRNCCNPDHLEVVTQQENILRGIGLSALNARKTHCIHGHEFTSQNTYITTSNKRKCRTCHNNESKKHKLKKASKA